MENKYFIEDFHIDVNRDTVFNMLDCFEDSPVYEEVCDAFEERKPWFYAHVRPRAVLAWEPWSKTLRQELDADADTAADRKEAAAAGRTEAADATAGQTEDDAAVGRAVDCGAETGAEADVAAGAPFAGLMYLLMTLGPEVEAESGRCFATGDYLEGMLLDAMADDYLFQMEDKVSEEMRLLCGRIGMGIQKRMEAPQDFPMAFHRRVLQVCGVASLWDMSLSSGDMFAPVKTSCVVFGLTKDVHIFRAQHDCSHCPAVNCKMRAAV